MTLVRERALATAVQTALERLYQLERVADVHAFVEAADASEREALLVRSADDGALEIALRLPPLAGREFDAASGRDLDPLCQLIEGVSHFVYLTECARIDRATTHLELELQAEVDKFVVLAASLRPFDVARCAALRERLYEDVRFLDDHTSEAGERYRTANTLAARFVRRIETVFIKHRRYRELQGELRRFFRMSQAEKVRTALAA
jgi:acetolactate synthase small subunit